MGFIVVRPRDPASAGGFRGIVFPFPWGEQVLKAQENLGGPEHAQILIVRYKDGKAIDIQVYEPPDGQERHKEPP